MGTRHSTPLTWLRVTLQQLDKPRRPRRFNPAEESAFQHFHANAVFGQARFGIALGLLVWIAFAFWDVLGFPSIYGRLIAIRLLLIAPVLVWLWWRLATRSGQSRQHLQRYLIIGPAVASAGLLLMMWASYSTGSARAFQLFWPAFSALYFFLYALLGLQFKPAAVVGSVTFFVVLALGLDSGVESHIAGSALFQLGILNFIGMIVCARSEIHLRASFRVRQHYLRQLQTAQRERVNAQLARDEAMIQSDRAEAAMRLVEVERGKLAAASEEKERFFAAAYHDLQQPLSIIGLYAHLARLKLADTNAPGVEADLGVIERAGYEIGLMFKGVRDTWEIGQAEPVLEAVCVDAVLAEIKREFQERADRKGLSFRVRRSRQPASFAYSDRPLIKRALSNLVSNAIKYTERGGLVLGAISHGARMRIDVRDTGIGIPPEFESRIFDPYFQVANPGRNRTLGLGLGLSIVRQIEQTLPDHRLRCRSRPGRGSRFSLDVPLAPAVEPEASLTSAAPELPPATAILRSRYMLVVEDERAILNGLVEALRGAGCIAEGADSAWAARRLLAERDRCPDLLITDWRLEHGATGLDVVEALRGRFEWAVSTPVLFLTGELLPLAALSAFEGPHELYPKPIEYPALLDKICALLAPEIEDSAGAGSVTDDDAGDGSEPHRPRIRQCL